MSGKHKQKSVSTEQINDILNDKRPLTWVPLAPPDYIIDRSHLIDSFIERECVYMGTLSNTPTDIDLKKRSDLLEIIDKGHLSKKLASPTVECIISVSAQNIKLNRRIKPEAFVLRIPIEQIISMAYVRDNALHYVVILHSSNSIMSTSDGFLTIITTETYIKAEEMCSLVTQCFQIIYTEATLRNFDRQLYTTTSHLEYEYPPSVNMQYQDKKMTTGQVVSVNENDCNYNERESVYSELSASKMDLLQNYMVQLQKVLNGDEMRQFHASLTAWQKGSPFESFCEQTKSLLGSQRISLLADMRYFIDPADKFTLEQFLADFTSPMKSCSSRKHWSQLLAKSPLPIQMQRSLSYASTSNGVLSIYDEENSVREDFSSPTKSSANPLLADPSVDDEFRKNIDTLFHNVGDLDLIMSGDR